MRHLFCILLFVTSGATFAKDAKEITLKCNNPSSIVKLSCLNDSVDMNNCSNFEVKSSYLNSSVNRNYDLVRINDLAQEKVNEIYDPKESHVEAFNKSTTVFGKLILGAVEYPRMIALDAKLASENSKRKDIFLNGIKALTDNNNTGKVIANCELEQISNFFNGTELF